jgi:hypothetical protein
MGDALPPGADALLGQAKLARPFVGERLTGGLNNQVFRVDCGDGSAVVLKAYFHDAEDQRNRLAAEYDFLSAAAILDVDCVAKPLARDDVYHLGLYSFIDGTPASGDMDAAAVRQASDFILSLNARGRRGILPALKAASEACFSGADHLATVEVRLERLAAGFGDSPVERDAARFIADHVTPAWQRVRSAVIAGLGQLKFDPAYTLAEDERMLSPSDFGFHNAIKRHDGSYAFVDFEYAGWDDPAKLVGDAFNQVKVPLPPKLYATFRDAIAAWSGKPEVEQRRYDLIWPVYAVKWIVIMLNEFAATASRRRAFAAPSADIAERRAQQLAAARMKFAQLLDDFQLRAPV